MHYPNVPKALILSQRGTIANSWPNTVADFAKQTGSCFFRYLMHLREHSHSLFGNKYSGRRCGRVSVRAELPIFWSYSSMLILRYSFADFPQVQVSVLRKILRLRTRWCVSNNLRFHNLPLNGEDIRVFDWRYTGNTIKLCVYLNCVIRISWLSYACILIELYVYLNRIMRIS